MATDKENMMMSEAMIFSPPKAAPRKARNVGNSATKALRDPVLKCAQFQESLWLTFGTIAVNMRKELSFQLENPNMDKNVVVEVNKVPTKKGFSIVLGDMRTSSITIAPGGKVWAYAEWQPREDMSVREIAYLKMDKRLPLQVTLHGIAGTGEARSKGGKDGASKKRKGLRSRSVNGASSGGAEDEDPVVKKQNVNNAMALAAKRVKMNKDKGNPQGATVTDKGKDNNKTTHVSLNGVTHDDHWLEKQMQGFTDWMNYTFTRAEAGVQEDDEEAQAAVNDNAPESSNLRSVMERSRNVRMRQEAAAVFESSQVATAAAAVAAEVQAGRLSFRDDKDVHADIGLRALLIEMLLSYEVQWLRLALEVVYAEPITLPPSVGRTKMLSDEQRWRAVLKTFVVDRLLSDPGIAEELKKPLLPRAAQEKLSQQLRQHSLLAFLQVVLVADKCRSAALIKCPTLFVRSSPYKSSKAVLMTLNREFLAAQGDVVKRLEAVGYTVGFEQTYIDEHHYRISNIKVDLRDGVKLARLVEVLSTKMDLSPSLRVPANSRLQKMHNVGLVLSRLESAGMTLDGLEAKHIVDGHRDRTLLLLWKILYQYEYRVLVDETVLRREIIALDMAQAAGKYPGGGRIFRTRELERAPLAVSVAARTDEGYVVAPTTRYGRPFDASPLLAWCDSVAGRYGVPVSNVTTALADGRALCLLVHHYHPKVLPLHAIAATTRNLFEAARAAAGPVHTENDADAVAPEAPETVPAEMLVSPHVLERALDAERRNFAVLRRACHEIGGIPLMLPAYDTRNLPEEKTITVFLGYLFARLVESSAEVAAATAIQNFCRAHLPSMRRLALDQARHRARAEKKKRSQMKRKHEGVSAASDEAPGGACDEGPARAIRARTVQVAVVVTQSKASAASVIQKQMLKVLVQRRLLAAADQIREADRAFRAQEEAAAAEQARLVAEHERALEADRLAEAAAAQARVDEETAEMAARAEEAQRLLDFRRAADEQLDRCRRDEEEAIAQKREAEFLVKLEEARAEAERNALAAAEAEKAELLAQINAFSGEMEHSEAARQMEADRREDLEERLAEVEASARETERRIAMEHEKQTREHKMVDKAAVRKERQARVVAEEAVRKEAQMRAHAVKKERTARVAAETRVRAEAEARIQAEEKVKEMERMLTEQAERAKAAEEACVEAAAALEAQAAARALEEEEAARMAAEQTAVQAAEEEAARLEAAAAAARKEEEARQHAEAMRAEQEAAAAAAALRHQEAEHAAREAAQAAVLQQQQEQQRTARRCEDAARRIARWFMHRCLPQLRVHRMVSGFKRLQGVWQSRHARTAANAELKAMRQRLAAADATARARPALTLGKQTKEALVTLQSGKMISHLLKACAVLETSTQLSQRCCADFAAASASGILFGLIRSCNRSKPHQELLRHALVIVLNVARHAHLAPQVAAAEHAADVLVDLMQMFRDKAAIFGLACELLCHLVTACPDTKLALHKPEANKRIASILTLVERKHRLENKVRSARGAAPTHVPSRSSSPTKGRKSFLCARDPIVCIKHLTALLE